jgi:cholesterol transport system auxiliary component
MNRRAAALLRLAAAAALVLGLSGCISLLPNEKPVPLYRFGVGIAPPAKALPGAERIGVARVPGQFQREASGDRMLTITGSKAAYIAGARWVAPAEALFDEALLSAFESGSGRVRLIPRGEPAKAAYVMRVDVRNFETHYNGGQPTVLVRVRAVLLRPQDRSAVSEQIFEAEAPASENRLHAIVAAYNQAVGQVLTDVVAWVDVTLP